MLPIALISRASINLEDILIKALGIISISLIRPILTIPSGVAGGGPLFFFLFVFARVPLFQYAVFVMIPSLHSLLS